MAEDDMTADEPPEAVSAAKLAEAIKPLLAGQPPAVAGAALADLVALFICGHVADGLLMTKKLRETMLDLHVKLVRALMPVHDRAIRERMGMADDQSKDRPN